MTHAKAKLLKPRLLDCVDRLRRLIEIDAPSVVIGAESWHVFATTLATYGSAAGSTMIQNITERNLHMRGVCSFADCTHHVNRPELGICEFHQEQLGLQDMTEHLTGDEP